jgi:hypothetical protein
MRSKNDNLSIWASANAWREIFARIFENIETRYNVSPEWLVNPATNRRLKLDMLYPAIGVAVRLEGLPGKQRRQRPSLEEEEQERMRWQARVEVCRAHNIELILIDAGDNPKTIFRTIDEVLGRANRQVTDTEVSSQITGARATAAHLARRIKSHSDLSLYVDLWQDRQYQIPEPANTPAPTGQTIAFFEGMEVEHTVFGPGVVLSITPSGNDSLLSVDFVTSGPKTLAASLVAGKLRPR